MVATMVIVETRSLVATVKGLQLPKKPTPENCHYLICLVFHWIALVPELVFIWYDSAHIVYSTIYNLLLKKFQLFNSFFEALIPIGTKKKAKKIKRKAEEWHVSRGLSQLQHISVNIEGHVHVHGCVHAQEEKKGSR